MSRKSTIKLLLRASGPSGGLGAFGAFGRARSREFPGSFPELPGVIRDHQDHPGGPPEPLFNFPGNFSRGPFPAGSGDEISRRIRISGPGTSKTTKTTKTTKHEKWTSSRVPEASRTFPAGSGDEISCRIRISGPGTSQNPGNHQNHQDHQNPPGGSGSSDGPKSCFPTISSQFWR